MTPKRVLLILRNKSLGNILSEFLMWRGDFEGKIRKNGRKNYMQRFPTRWRGKESVLKRESYYDKENIKRTVKTTTEGSSIEIKTGEIQDVEAQWHPVSVIRVIHEATYTVVGVGIYWILNYSFCSSPILFRSILRSLLVPTLSVDTNPEKTFRNIFSSLETCQNLVFQMRISLLSYICTGFVLNFLRIYL